jgi:hypothetical protein
MQKFFNVANITSGIDNYTKNESYETETDKIQIQSFKNNCNLNKSQIPQIIQNLEDIKEIARQNQEKIKKLIDNINYVKNILDKQINDLKSSDTLKNLKGIESTIYSICADQWNIYYSRISELEYRQYIVSYKIVFLKQQYDNISLDIELINKYIIALQEIQNT